MGIKEYSFDKIYKIIFIGDKDTQETKIISRILGYNNINKNTDYNQEFCGEKKIKFINKNFKFQIFDLRGRNINYIEGFSLVFLVYNVDKLTTFNNIPKYVEKNIENIKMVLCGNKNSCGKRKVEKKVGEKLAKKKNMLFFECDPDNVENIKIMFYSSIVELLIDNKLDKYKIMVIRELLKKMKDILIKS